MATSLNTIPHILEPVYTPFYFNVDSTLWTLPEFKYVVDIYRMNYSAGTLSTRVRTKYFPYFSGGALTFSPARILENFVTSDNNYFSSTSFVPAMSSLGAYRLRFGEEWTVLSNSTFTAVTNNGGFAQLNFPTAFTAPQGGDLKVGDEIKVYHDDYDFYHTVKSVESSTDYTLNTTMSGTSSGQCTYRMTINSGATFSGLTLNCARDYAQPYFNYWNKYNMQLPFSSTSNLFLSDFSGGTPIVIGRDDNYPLSFILSSSTPARMVYKFYSPGGVLENTSYINNTSSLSGNSGIIRWSSIVAMNANSFDEDALGIATTIDYFEVFISTGSLGGLFPDGIQVSNTQRFVPEKGCRANKIRLMWQNSVGGHDCWNFYRSSTQLKVKRNTYQKFFNPIYSQNNAGEQVYSLNANNIITCYSDYVTLDQYNALKNIYTSRNAYIIDASNQATIPVIIQSEDLLTEDNGEDLYFIEIKYKYSNQINTTRS